MNDENVQHVEQVVASKEATVELGQSPITADETEVKLEPQAVGLEYLSFLNVNVKELNKRAENYPKLDASTGNLGKVWLEAFVKAQEHLHNGDVFTATVERDEAKWRQKVEIDGEQLAAARPRFGGGAGGQVLSGERALLKATSVLGLGAVVQVPLWHTGIWVSLKAPSESALLELERRIANEKISLGRYTSGMIFSNTSVYTVSHVVNFALSHIYDASVPNIKHEALRDLIKVTDIPTLIWGLVCTIYPNGYKYSRPCTTNPAECQHVVTGMINIARLSWTDNAQLSEWQRRHMVRRNEKCTTEDLERYEREHVRGGNKTISINDQLKVCLRVPTLSQYESAGFAWVDNIVKKLEGSLGVSLKGQERDDYITDQGRLTALRQYSHWVERIEIGEDSVEDQDTIEVMLGTLSSDEEIANKLFEGIGQYIDNATISLIAIPKYPCPKCGGEQHGDIHQVLNPHLLPIDVTKLFFTLLDQRIYKALAKAQL